MIINNGYNPLFLYKEGVQKAGPKTSPLFPTNKQTMKQKQNAPYPAPELTPEIHPEPEPTTETPKPKAKPRATWKSQKVFNEISELTSLPPSSVQDVFEAFARLTQNNMLQGINIALPYIGTVRLNKQYYPEKYAKHSLGVRYGTCVVESMGNRVFTIVFAPTVRISSRFRQSITDKLPTNLDAHNLGLRPYIDDTKKYPFERLSSEILDNADQENE